MISTNEPAQLSHCSLGVCVFVKEKLSLKLGNYNKLQDIRSDRMSQTVATNLKKTLNELLLFTFCVSKIVVGIDMKSCVTTSELYITQTVHRSGIKLFGQVDNTTSNNLRAILKKPHYFKLN